MKKNDELLDLVNADDQVIGTIWRSGVNDAMAAEKQQYIRSIEVFLVNSTGQLWVPRRTMHKKLFPGGLDYSAAGHIDSGESYEQAAIREITEELNLSLTPAQLEVAGTYIDSDISYIRRVYLYRTNEAPQYNPDDYQSAQWLTPEELLAQLDAGVPAKMSIRRSVVSLLESGLVK